MDGTSALETSIETKSAPRAPLVPPMHTTDINDHRLSHAFGKRHVSLQIAASKIILLNKAARPSPTRSETPGDALNPSEQKSAGGGTAAIKSSTTTAASSPPQRADSNFSRDGDSSSPNKMRRTSTVYVLAQSLSSQELQAHYYRGPFRTDLPTKHQLTMTVVDCYDDVASKHRFSDCVYVIQLTYCGYRWTQRIRRTPLLSLHLALKRQHKYIRVRNGMKKLPMEKELFFIKLVGTNFHFPRELKLSVNNYYHYTKQQRVRSLQKYLNCLVRIPLVLHHHLFAEFFHVSNFTFDIRYVQNFTLKALVHWQRCTRRMLGT